MTGQGGEEVPEQPGGVDGLLLHVGGVLHGESACPGQLSSQSIKPVELSTTEVVLDGKEQMFLLKVPRLLEGGTHSQGLRLVSFKTSQV